MVVGMGSYNLLSETKRVVEDCFEQKRNQRLAEAAWQQVVMECGDTFGPNYACGFKFGFGEYLYRGTCEPPAVPPIKLRSLKYQSAEGCEAVAQWRAGFRHGVSVARESGYRNYVTCWLEAGAGGPPPAPSLPGDPAGLPGAPLPTPSGPVLPSYQPSPGSAGPTTPGEMLPAPRQVPQPGKEEPTPPLGRREASVPRMLQMKAESTLPVEVPEEFEQTFVTIPASGPK